MKFAIRFFFTVLALITFSPLATFALDAPRSDSLIRVAKNQKNIDLQLATLEEMSLEFLWVHPLLADSLVNELGRLAGETNQTYYQARSQFFKGMLKYKWQNLEKAFEHYSDARKILEEIDSLKALAEVYHNMSLVHIRLSEREEAMEFLKKAQLINEKGGYIEQLIKNKLVLASLEPTYEKQLEAFHNIGILSEEKNYIEGQFISKINVATILNNSGDPDSALEVLASAEKLITKTGYDKYNHNIFQLKGVIYNRLEQFDLAEENLIKALEINEKKDQKARILELYLNLSGIYVKQEKYREAYNYLDKHRKLRYTFDLQKKAESVAKIEADYRVELEKKENALLRKKAETARKQRVLLGLLLFLTLITIALLTARYSTRQKHVRELENVNTQLNALNLEMESVLQVVSHDFRTPLSKIRMINELIISQEGALLSDNVRAKLDKIDGSVREAEGLVSDILEIKRFYTNEDFESNPEAFDLPSEMNSIIQQYQTPIDLKALTINYEHKGEPVVIQEREVLKRIVNNLFSNAVKFTYENKSIRIETINQEGTLTIRIKDEGPGFAEDDKDKVFEKFARFSNKPIKWGTSHGLGLYIVRKLVDRLHGNIEVHSKPEEGAEFVIRVSAEVG